MRTRTIAAWLVLAVASTANAAAPPVPDQFTYQAVLLDDQGMPRTGNVDLTLRIYDALGGGTLLYVQTLSAVPLTDGVFTVTLGPTGDATDTPVDPLTTSLVTAVAGDLSGTGPGRFLEVTVGLTGALARTQILTVPYAVRAGSAATADDAQTAVVATTTTSFGGLGGDVFTQIYENTNLDNSGPPNTDPSEGLGDTDLDGIANFVDPDNDGDGIDDSTEVSQGSDINLVTPTLVGVTPAAGFRLLTQTLTVSGTNFEPGLGVGFGTQAPTPANVTPTSFEISVGPQAIGTVDLTVTLPNAESATAPGIYEFVESVSHTVAGSPGGINTFGLTLGPPPNLAVSGVDEYQVDADGNYEPEATMSFASAGEIAIGFDPAGALVGLRCRPGATPCSVEVTRDSDADLALTDETPVVVETLADPADYILATSLAFGPSGELVLGYKKLTQILGAVAVVAHDRDGDNQFTGPNEVMNVEFPTGAVSRGEVAVDGSGRAAYVYVNDPSGAPPPLVQVAWDRSGDGDFDDAPGGVPELSTLVAPTDRPTCLGAGFAPDGDLAVVYGGGGNALTFARDTNQDGDFTDAGETTVLDPDPEGACDLAGGGGNALSVGYLNTPGELRLLVDRNDDGDFADALENVVLGNVDADTEQVAVAHDPSGVAFVATQDVNTFSPLYTGEVFADTSP